jgi:hypothetical protein
MTFCAIVTIHISNTCANCEQRNKTGIGFIGNCKESEISENATGSLCMAMGGRAEEPRDGQF